jgi:plastocyanin
MTFVPRIAHRNRRPTWRLALALGLLLESAVVVATVVASPLDVSIVDKSFQPATTTVNVGDTVTWTVTQSNGELHSVTSGKPGTDQGKDFDSGIVLKDNGQSYQFTFAKAGTYDYFCQVHASVMTGQVIVTAAGQSPPPASEAPATSAAPSAAPSAAASAAPVVREPREAIPPERKLLGAAILAVTLVVLFGAAALWRRMNPA